MIPQRDTSFLEKLENSIALWSFVQRLRACLPDRMEYFELSVAPIPTDDRNRKSALTPVILDGAHVPFNLAAVLRDLGRIRELAGFSAVVFGTGRDKRAFEMLELLGQNRVDVVICTRSISGPRPWAPDELRGFARGLELAAEEFPEPCDALMRASALATGRGWILVTGSLHIVGEGKTRQTADERRLTQTGMGGVKGER